MKTKSIDVLMAAISIFLPLTSAHAAVCEDSDEATSTGDWGSVVGCSCNGELTGEFTARRSDGWSWMTTYGPSNTEVSVLLEYKYSDPPTTTFWDWAHLSGSGDFYWISGDPPASDPYHMTTGYLDYYWTGKYKIRCEQF
jgi:hypothetical protein